MNIFLASQVPCRTVGRQITVLPVLDTDPANASSAESLYTQTVYLEKEDAENRKATSFLALLRQLAGGCGAQNIGPETENGIP